MEVISYVQAGNMESLKGWLEEHPDPDGSMLTFGGVSVMHWAASSNTEVHHSVNGKLNQATPPRY
jgi:hypothetical protein